MSDNCSKSSILRSKLQLKKNNTESADKDEKPNKIVPDDNCETKETSVASVNDKDDSISDFKSPQRVTVTSVKLFTSKSSNLREKGKSKSKYKSSVSKKKETSSKILGLSKKENLDNSQPLIESSFFKLKNNSESKDDVRATAFVCPLCFKSMKNENIHSSHVKSCAIKNNISTKKLLEIVELQKRQAQERKSLGLLAAPVLQDRKKPATHKTNIQEDSELQLAIALSKSLHEAEQLDELNEIAVLNGIPDKFTPNVGEGECKKVTLERLGFTSNRPIVENTTNRIKKKKLYGLTVLQTRSQEERNRILTERIAEVLIGNDILTQKQVPEQREEDQKIIVLHSSILKEYHRTEERLWDKASLMSSHRDFYVPNLSEHISPIETQLSELNKEEIVVENNLNLGNPQYTIEASSNKEQEKMETESSSPIKIAECVKEPFVNTLVTDWGNALNNSSASDVIIFVKDNKHIWTHKLVFYVRCPNILLDIVLNNDPKFYSTKEKICWTDIAFEVAFAFLEFIYCGFIKTHTVAFNDPEMLSGIRCLARKYKVKELFEYLRKVEDECISKRIKNEIERMEVAESRDNVSSCEILESNDQIVNSSKKLTTRLSGENLTINFNATSNIQIGSPVSEESEKITDHYLSQDVHVRPRSVSPDMFEDTSDQMSTNNCTSHIPKDENSDLNMLLSLVNHDLQSSITEPDTFKPLKESSSPLTEEKYEKLRSSQECTKQTSGRSKSEYTKVSPIAKQKSDISIFIERIRRQNAKGDSDFDSEIDSPINVRSQSHGNPFQVHRRSESEGSLKAAAEIGNLTKKPSALSMLESDVQQIRQNFTEDFDKSNEIWIDDDKDEELGTNLLQKDESTANNVNRKLSQEHTEKVRQSRLNASNSRGDLDWRNSFDDHGNFELSTLSLPDRKKSLYTEIEKIPSRSSTQSQSKRMHEKHGNVSKSPRKLSQSSVNKSLQNDAAKTNMSASFSVNDSVFSSTSLKTEEEDAAHKTCNSSKRKKSLDSPSSQKSQSLLRNNLNRSDRGKEVLKSNRSPRKLSQSSLDKSLHNDDAKTNMSASFSVNDSAFSSTSLEKEDKDAAHKTCNSSKRKKSSDSPSSRKSQSLRQNSLETSNKGRNSIEDLFHDTATSDDDESMEDVSMYSRYKKEHLYNSIADYRAALAEHFGKQEKLSSEYKSSEELDKEMSPAKHEISAQNVEDSDNLSTTSTVLLKERAAKDFAEESTDDSPLSLTQELFTKNNRSTKNRAMLKNAQIYDADTDVENENEDSVRNVRSLSQNFTDFPDASNDGETNASTCSRKSHHESEETGTQQNNSQENFPDKRKTADARNSGDNSPNIENTFDREEPVSHSPILISSSPDDVDVEFVSYAASQTNDNESNNLKPSEDPDDEIDSIFYQDLNLANVHTERRKYNQPITSSINDLQESPILNRFANVTSRKRRTEMEDFTEPSTSNAISKRNKSFGSNESNDVSPKGVDASRQKLKRTRQLKVKSVSEGNISINKSSREIPDIRRFSSTQCERTPEKNKDTRSQVNEVNPQLRRASHERKNNVRDEDLYRRYKDIFGDEDVIIIDKDVTPPPDYDNMSTPELHKEMKRYGLKLQKRSRAVKLLNYIYNETHPLIPLSDEPCENKVMNSDTEDRSPPAKKPSQHNLRDEEDCDVLSQNSVASKGDINPEEMEFDEPESGPSTSDNPKSVAEAFRKLLEADRDLHNRILMYEPINLMEVHATLKANGFKCNVNALMDYLDEQCITFCVPENSVRRKTRKK